MGDAQTGLTKENISCKYLFWLKNEREITGYKEEERKARILSVGRKATCVTVGNLGHSPSIHAHIGCWRRPVMCTDTWRQKKPFLSYTVIPSHKSVLSHPLCADKATKHRLIHTRNGERERLFSLLWVASLALSHTPFPIFVICFSFIRSEQQTSLVFFFFPRLGLVCLQLAIFSLVAFPTVWLWSSEELVNHSQHSHKLSW